MTYHKTRFFVLVFVALATCVGSSATAGQVMFSDQMTANLVYSSIKEINDSITSGHTLYGGIGTSGQSLVFETENFRLESCDGVGALDGRISFDINAKPGNLITSVTISEGGRASAFGQGSLANVHLGGFVTINGHQSGPQQASYTLDGISGAPANDFWDESVVFEFDPARVVSVDFDNALFVLAAEDGFAFIDKKGMVVEVGTVGMAHMPEPSSALALFAVGLATATFRRRR